MLKLIETELKLESLRAKFLKYTRIAFNQLPKLERPRILDVGCGSGIPTLELAELSDGVIVAIDTDITVLNELDRKIERQRLSRRITPLNVSLLKVDFPAESFDLIWAEGSLDLIGYRKSLKVCNRLLKPNGFLVVGDQVSRFQALLKSLPSYGYILFHSYVMPEDIWWTEYYAPLELRLQKILQKYHDDPTVKSLLDRYQREVAMVKSAPNAFACAFYILQRTERPSPTRSGPR